MGGIERGVLGGVLRRLFGKKECEMVSDFFSVGIGFLLRGSCIKMTQENSTLVWRGGVYRDSLSPFHLH